MAYFLDGAQIAPHANGLDIVSDGIVMGCDPGAGRRPADGADGGSPGHRRLSEDRDRHRADLGSLAQHRAGETVRFAAVTVEEAVAAWRAALAEVEGLTLRPLIGRKLTSEFLLGVNLVDGVTSGRS